MIECAWGVVCTVCNMTTRQILANEFVTCMLQEMRIAVEKRGMVWAG